MNKISLAMIKKIICLILIMTVIFSCFSPNRGQSEKNASNTETVLCKTDSVYLSNEPIENIYSERIKLCIDGINNKYKDTVLNFRNYIEGNDLRRIVCNNQVIDKDIETLICESKYVGGWHLETLKDLNCFSFISYNTDNQGNTIVRYFWCNRRYMKADEEKRFLIKNKRIVGINVSPDRYEGFISIEEYEYPPGGIKI